MLNSPSSKWDLSPEINVVAKVRLALGSPRPDTVDGNFYLTFDSTGKYFS